MESASNYQLKISKEKYSKWDDVTQCFQDGLKQSACWMLAFNCVSGSVDDAVWLNLHKEVLIPSHGQRQKLVEVVWLDKGWLHAQPGLESRLLISMLSSLSTVPCHRCSLESCHPLLGILSLYGLRELFAMTFPSPCGVQTSIKVVSFLRLVLTVI